VGEALKVNVQVRNELAPGFNPSHLEMLLEDVSRDEIVMLAGHEPDFSTVIGHVIGGGRVVVKKGGLARIDVTAFHPIRGELVWMIAPKVLDGASLED
jgi:phosphohistidine phosphatase